MATWPPPSRPCAGRAAGIQQAAADDGEEQDAEEQSHQPDVQPHVAVQDVAELVGDDALQLLAVQPLERAARDGYGGVIDGVAGGEGVDAGLVVEHVDGRHGRARRDGHLLHDVDEPALRLVGGVRADSPAAQQLGDAAAALPELQGAHRAADADQHGRAGRRPAAGRGRRRPGGRAPGRRARRRRWR
jgi:hypothetical protein